jgi:hypothetical protein
LGFVDVGVKSVAKKRAGQVQILHLTRFYLCLGSRHITHCVTGFGRNNHSARLSPEGNSQGGFG